MIEKKELKRPHKAARRRIGMNKDRNFVTWMPTRKGFGKRYRYSKDRQKDKDIIARDKELLSLLDVKDDYEIPRLLTKLIRERWSVYDIMRILLEGYILDDVNILKYIISSTDDEKAYPPNFRALEEEDALAGEELRGLFDDEYLSAEEKSNLFDVIEE